MEKEYVHLFKIPDGYTVDVSFHHCGRVITDFYSVSEQPNLKNPLSYSISRRSISKEGEERERILLRNIIPELADRMTYNEALSFADKIANSLELEVVNFTKGLKKAKVTEEA